MKGVAVFLAVLVSFAATSPTPELEARGRARTMWSYSYNDYRADQLRNRSYAANRR